jgi:hypothetical protein
LKGEREKSKRSLPDTGRVPTLMAVPPVNGPHLGFTPSVEGIDMFSEPGE